MVSPGPIAFSIMEYDIRWYGVLIGIGVILAVFLSYMRSNRYEIEQERILDIVIWVLPIGIVGARLYYVLFSWDYYMGDISKIINIRNGGLAIHGGIIAGALAAYFICKHYKLEILKVLDLFLPGVAIAQAIGRWGNFFNSEAHGGPTDLPWAILVNGEYVHPTFLYESIWCLALGIFLITFERKRLFSGQIACLYGILYSAERFFVEGLRTDSLMIGEFRQAQVISVCIILACLIIYTILYKRNKLLKEKNI
ncbi:MAG TPA: prolipoprotein diacylglyceryl transferase [Anaerovoracaceae bacterium]|nr:prolipoprotein diacylglyceryl transferase [Anaerovoracaceae bacterium]